MKSGLIIPLSIKALGMICSYSLVVFIIQNYGLEGFGEYSLVISFLLLLSGIAAYGFPQSFIRDTVLMNFFQKKKVFLKMNFIIIIFALILTPVVYFYLSFSLNFPTEIIFVLIIVYLIMATSRLRFSLLRTTKYVKLSEIPEQIIRPIVIISFLLLFGTSNSFDLYTALLLGFISALFVNYILASKYYSKNIFLNTFDKNLIIGNTGKVNFYLWIFNSMLLLKDFLEIFLFSYFYGNEYAGEYKLILQIFVVFMAVFNSMALINTSKYAKLIAINKVNKINLKAKEDMYSSVKWLMLIGLVILFSEVFWSVLDYLKFSIEGKLSLLLFFLLALLNIVIGPVRQMLMHLKCTTELILVTLFKIAAVILIILISRYLEVNNIFDICILFVLSEFIALLIMSLVLNNRIGFISPIKYMFVKKENYE